MKYTVTVGAEHGTQAIMVNADSTVDAAMQAGIYSARKLRSVAIEYGLSEAGINESLDNMVAKQYVVNVEAVK